MSNMLYYLTVNNKRVYKIETNNGHFVWHNRDETDMMRNILHLDSYYVFELDNCNLHNINMITSISDVEWYFAYYYNEDNTTDCLWFGPSQLRVP